MRKIFFTVSLLVLALSFALIHRNADATPRHMVNGLPSLTPSTTWTPTVTVTPTYGPTSTPTPLPANGVRILLTQSSPVSLPRASFTITVTLLKTDSSPLPGVTVNVVIDDVLFGSGITDQNGSMSVSPNNLFLGDHTITVSTNAPQLGYTMLNYPILDHSVERPSRPGGTPGSTVS